MTTCLAVCAARPAAAQGTVLRGVVVDSATGEPLDQVLVVAAGTAARARSGADGNFILRGLPSGSVTLHFTRIGYRQTVLTGVLAGAPLHVRLAALSVPMQEVVVTASRSRSAVLDAPVAISVVDRQQIADQPALTPIEHIRTVTGVDFASKGLLQTTFDARGGRGANAGDLLMLTDYRYAAVPSIGFDIPYLIGATDDDIERIEVVRGPGAALYGPGASRGVLQIVTRSPFESPGGEVSLMGGQRSIADGTFRYAAVPAPWIGVKVSGNYFRGRDWEYADPFELAARAAALQAGANPDTLLTGRRDYNVRRAGGEARVDLRPGGGTEVVTTVGLSDAISIIDLTPALGGVQGKNWRYGYAQTRLRRGRLFANFVYDLSNAGDSYLLWTGGRLVDHSRVYAAQLQDGATLGPVNLLYGSDARWTDPRTGGTIDGVNENNDLVAELGAYVHGTMTVARRWDLTAALRGDHHNRLNDLAFSPRLAVVFHPTPRNAFRVSYNRAFTSPDANDLFLDIRASSLGGTPFDIWAVGVPKNGYTFPRDCGGGLCMRSPYARRGVNDALPLDATRVWSAIPDSFGVAGIPAPTAAQVKTDLAALDANSQYVPTTAAAVTTIPALRRTITNTLEAGYKGLFDRVRLALDLYVNRVSDIQGARVAATPNAFLDEATLRAYLGNYMSPAQAAATAAKLAAVPLGTVSPAETAHPGQILLVDQQGGAYTFWGVDLDAEVALTPALSVEGTYSWVSADSIGGVDVIGDAILGVPRNKGALSLTYHDDALGLDLAARGRALDGFSVRTGALSGYVAPYAVLDLTGGFRIPGAPMLRLDVTAQNIFNDVHREYIVSPKLGRLVLVRLHAGL